MAVTTHDQLLEVLSKIDRPGTFCTSGHVAAVLPGLEVGEAGLIGLPLEDKQAALLKKQARQAPYGQGEETLVDTDVRNVWEIDADQVALTNPEWPTVIDQVVGMVQAGLGLQTQKLEAHLYKLLLYEAGSFFVSHRDGEKLDRMVATLVVVLPSLHTGGELVVRHEGCEQTVDFAPDSAFRSQFAAFYADCEHEIRPVNSGHRLTLVYNLTLAKSKRKKAITAPTRGAHITHIADILREDKEQTWKTSREDQSRPTHKLAVLLEHQYTQAGLTLDALKGVDRVRAEILFEAAGQAGYDASLALVTYWESGMAEPTGGYSPRRRSRYGYYDDDYSDSYDADDYEMGEIYDESLTAEHFTDAEGKSLNFGRIALNKNEIVTGAPFSEGEPDKTDVDGYLGNEGLTMERWYHAAAVVLWPEEDRYDLLCEAGNETAVAGLQQMVRQWKRAKKSEKPALKEQCVEFAQRIIARWHERRQATPYRYSDDDEARKAKPAELLPLLEELGDQSLISAWISGIAAKDLPTKLVSTLGDICKQHGWLTFQNELQDLFASSSKAVSIRNAHLLADLSLRKDKNADRLKLCTLLAQEMTAALERWEPETPHAISGVSSSRDAGLLPPLVQSILKLEQPELLERITAWILDRPRVFDLTTVQVPALINLEAWLKRNVKRPVAPLRGWLGAVCSELEARAAHPPQAPADWRRKANITCKCADCKALVRFLQDPEAETLRLPLAKDRRQHLHRTIDSKGLDLTHVTERVGRPFTLVCTKTNASYQRVLKAHQVDLDQLDKIQKLLAWHDGLKG